MCVQATWRSKMVLLYIFLKRCFACLPQLILDLATTCYSEALPSKYGLCQVESLICLILQLFRTRLLFASSCPFSLAILAAGEPLDSSMKETCFQMQGKLNWVKKLAALTSKLWMFLPNLCLLRFRGAGSFAGVLPLVTSSSCLNSDNSNVSSFLGRKSGETAWNLLKPGPSTSRAGQGACAFRSLMSGRSCILPAQITDKRLASMR